MRILSSVLVVTVALSLASPALAQSTGTSSSRRQAPATPKAPKPPKPPAPPLPKPVRNIRAFGALDFEVMSASKSFDAVTGSSLMIGYGGGGEVVNLWQRLFVRGDFTAASSSGERAFVIDNDVVSMGVPITVKLNTVEIAAGWRFPMRRHLKYTPYAGGAVLFTKYSEKSDFEQPIESVKESSNGYAVLGGIDAQINKRFYATFEAQYRMVPDALGKTGVSKLYEETDLGGFVARVMIGYNLIKKK